MQKYEQIINVHIFLLLGSDSSLYFLDTNPISNIILGNMAFQFVASLFTLQQCFQTVEILNFDKVQFIFLFSFIGYTLAVIFKRSLPMSESHRFSLVFFQKFYFYWALHLGLWSI